MANEPSVMAGGDPTYLIHTFEHRAYPLTGGRSLTIGRDTDCDIVVNEVFVSRHHAELRPDRPDGDGYVLHSTGANPTILNNEPMTAPHVLQEGDHRVDCAGSARIRGALKTRVSAAAPAMSTPQYSSNSTNELSIVPGRKGRRCIDRTTT